MGQKSKSKIIRKKKDAKKKKASKNQKEPRTWKQFFFRFSFFVFFCVIVYVFLCSNLVRVNHFEVQGIDDLSEERILNTTRSVLEGEFYKYFKKDNYFLVDVKSVKQEVMQDKRIKDVVVEKKFPQTMIIKITKHKVIPVWCTDESKNECFMLEENIVANKVDINDDIILHNRHFVVVNEGIQTIENGQRIMAEEYFSKIEILGEELTYVLNAEIKQPYVIASRGSHEVRFVTDEGWYLVVDLTHDV
ncbi:MAG: FtsQ-type POTRA domain-containing protein, partial [Patescibacteria group bacterium]